MSIRGNDFGKRILEILKENPKGMTVTEISKVVGAHRHTVTKYICQPLGSCAIDHRSVGPAAVGPAKICYLKREKG